MFSSQIPIFISIAFIIAILFPIIMIANLTKKVGDDKLFFPIIIFYVLYLSVVSIASFNGFFDTISLPPKIVITTTLPLLLFYLIFISNTKKYKAFLKNIELSDLVKVHIFRLIGSFFIILFLLELLPKPFALVAGIGDITTAISSLFIAKMIRNKKSFYKKATLIWNTFGLADILITSFLAILFTKWNIETGSLGVDILAKFPFCFIPAFAPATIILLHISIYRKILSKKFN